LRVGPLGDAAAYAEFSETLDLEVNQALQSLAFTLRARAPAWVHEIVPALTGVAVHFDPEHADLPAAPLAAAEALIRDCIDAMPSRAAGRTIEVPVLLRPRVRARRHRGRGKIRHRARRHRAAPQPRRAFRPDGRLFARAAVSRRARPGACAATAGNAAHARAGGVGRDRKSPDHGLPVRNPGGWSVIGRTPLVLFDPAREPPSVFSPGDRVRFVAISRTDYARLK
jgi:hypothetical protein